MDQWIVTIVTRTDVSISNLILTRLCLVAKGCAAAWFAGDVRELLGFRHRYTNYVHGIGNDRGVLYI